VKNSADSHGELVDAIHALVDMALFTRFAFRLPSLTSLKVLLILAVS
jgi:hypothetical protein